MPQARSQAQASWRLPSESILFLLLPPACSCPRSLDALCGVSFVAPHLRCPALGTATMLTAGRLLHFVVLINDVFTEFIIFRQLISVIVLIGQFHAFGKVTVRATLDLQPWLAIL